VPANRRLGVHAMMTRIVENAAILKMNSMMRCPRIERLAALSLRQKKIEIVRDRVGPVVFPVVERTPLVDRVTERIGVPIPDMPRHWFGRHGGEPMTIECAFTGILGIGRDGEVKNSFIPAGAGKAVGAVKSR
jgi:hypothetical protein